MYQPYGHNDEYTGNYTIGRMGGNAQTRFNYKINARNSGHDYYFINQASDFTWQQFYSTASKSGLSFWTQIPAMGMKDGYIHCCFLHLFGEYISLFVYCTQQDGWLDPLQNHGHFLNRSMANNKLMSVAIIPLEPHGVHKMLGMEYGPMEAMLLGMTRWIRPFERLLKMQLDLYVQCYRNIQIPHQYLQ